MEPWRKLLLDHGISLGRALVYFPSKMLVANLTDKIQWLFEGTEVARLQEVDVTNSLSNTDDEIPIPEDPPEDENAFLQTIYKRINAEIPPPETEKLRSLLTKHHTCFAQTSRDLGEGEVTQHHIAPGDALPSHQQPFKSAWKKREVINRQVEEMLRDGLSTHPVVPGLHQCS